MMLMMQNLGSNPNISCRIITELVMISGFLYLIRNAFILAAAAAWCAARGRGETGKSERFFGTRYATAVLS